MGHLRDHKSSLKVGVSCVTAMSRSRSFFSLAKFLDLKFTYVHFDRIICITLSSCKFYITFVVCYAKYKQLRHLFEFVAPQNEIPNETILELQ